MPNIVDILSNAGVPHTTSHKNVRSGWCAVDCLKCSPNTRKFRCGFELSTNRCHCWLCGSLYAPDILAQLLRISIREAHDLLGKPVRQKLPDDHQRIGTLRIPLGVVGLLPAHQSYLASRGFDPDEIVRLWGVRGIGHSAGLRWRIWIPIADKFGRVVSWTSRSISKDNPVRYWSATAEEEEVPHKSILYGAQCARHTIVICEGPLDVWSIGPGAVATLGVSYTPAQRKLMAEYPVRVVCFDSEPEAQRRAGALCRDLSAMPGTTENVVLETGKDANEAEKAEIQELRERYFPELVAMQ